jgi:hypothetical protein
MRYQLPNGIYITMSLEAYLAASDEDLAMLIGDDEGAGKMFDDPFGDSVIRYGEYVSPDDINDYFEEEIEDLLSLTSEDKITDKDFINIDELEI